MSRENVALVRRWFQEVWNERRTDTIDELLTPQSVCHTDDDELQGSDDFKARMHVPFLSALPDLRLELDSIISDGDHVVSRWHACATHTGDGLGCPPTGRTVTFRGMTWVRIEEGKFAEGWQYSNIPEVMRGLATA